MKDYPIMLRLAGKRCVVVGGGKVAERKIKSLLSTGAALVVVSPVSTEKITEWATTGQLQLLARPFENKDLDGAVLVIAATNQPEINLEIYQAIQPYQWINVVDRPDLCSFTVPATLERGDIQIAVSTGGKNPGLAKKLRKQLDQWIGEDYEEYVHFLGSTRQQVLSLGLDSERKKQLLQELLDDRFLYWTQEGNLEKRDEEVRKLINRLN
ncbi:bifunctional precorrin-2 dehydrogenase/sirohydrochlorin ferrochelatase [Ammoniphilus sp. YIM 78166]|uniref:precorrin-2 dehydrogenase/sirohydrochlorin ferrochelatase family protein n=1 Tax=Ammoniphilus sp. YIM 78166 TaxID=1644106 RepID=UPI00106F2140|nr:bifunctional precorrin-2 dehydrogenase/sirohydrochlorin ferrochelatase [Ammoniphilus sp. YIM 78166]